MGDFRAHFAAGLCEEQRSELKSSGILQTLSILCALLVGLMPALPPLTRAGSFSLAFGATEIPPPRSSEQIIAKSAPSIKAGTFHGNPGQLSL